MEEHENGRGSEQPAGDLLQAAGPGRIAEGEEPPRLRGDGALRGHRLIPWLAGTGGDNRMRIGGPDDVTLDLRGGLMVR